MYDQVHGLPRAANKASSELLDVFLHASSAQMSENAKEQWRNHYTLVIEIRALQHLLRVGIS